MEQRPASRTVTAYARGLYLAQIFQLAVAGIAILAVVIGAYMLSQQRAEYTKTKAALDAAKQQTDIQIAVNERLISGAVTLSQASPDDPFTAVLAYKRAHDEFQTALEILPVAEAGAGEDPWHQTRQAVRLMIAGTLTASGNLPDAIAAQVALRQAEPSGSDDWARYTVGLASLHCRSNDHDAAAALLTPAFRESHGALLADTTFIDVCGEALAFQQPGSRSPASEMPAADDWDGPRETVRQQAPAAIRRLFLHIRSEDQRRPAANLAERLCARGFNVEGIERVPPPRGYPSTPRTIYYYPDQAADAATISAIIQGEIADLGLGGWDMPFDARLFQGNNLPRNQVEIWFAETGGVREGLGPGRSSCQGAQSQGEQLEMLLAELDARTQQTRKNAGQQVADALRTDRQAEVADALIRQLESPQVDSLTATGRLNVLSMLNGVPSWDDPAQAARLSAALAGIEARAAAPGSAVAIGGQTRDCIDAIKLRLAGGDAPERCGGL